MGRNWKIQKAAVEQEVLFPSKKVFQEYLNGLNKKEEPYEIISESYNEDNSVTVVIRKRYNFNAFLYRGKRNATGFYEVRRTSDDRVLAQCDTREKLYKWYEQNTYLKNGQFRYLKSDNSSIYEQFRCS